MIRINLPVSDQKYFVVIQNGLVGPFSSNGALLQDSVSYRSKLDTLIQGRGNFHENDVDNVQLRGEVTYSPVDTELVAAPSTGYPYRTKWDCRYYSGSFWYNTTVYAQLGRVTDRYTSMSSASQLCQTAWQIIGNTVYVYQIYATLSKPNVVSSGVTWIYTIGSPSGMYAKLSYSFKNLYYAYPSGNLGIDWSVLQDFDTIVAACSHPSSTSGGSSSANAMYYTSRNAYSFSPSSFFKELDAWATGQYLWDTDKDFPVKGKDYGDLANDASSQVNANSVNMIAFLRDLRHPTEMIPKLRNLRNLKTMADNYLTVEYGWLPTISDLQTIVEAFKKQKPYLDKNGFSTYSAGFSDKRSIEDIDYYLEQHIKLGIDDYDSSAKALVGAVDSMGFLLTLQNAWDLIPYSFVLDWFVNVGDFLARLDGQDRLRRLNIRYTTSSRKTTVVRNYTPSIGSPLSGSVELVHYHRWTSDQCPVPPLSLSTSFQDFNHWLESTALLIQRRK